MNTIFDAINEVKRRPEMYMGKKSLTAMQIFLEGYSYAARQAGEWERLISENGIPYRYINDYAWNKYETSIISHHLLEIADRNEEHALKLFYELIDEIQQIKITNAWEICLTKKNRHFDRDEKYETFHFPNKVINLYSDAERVYKIELSDGAVYAAVQYIPSKIRLPNLKANCAVIEENLTEEFFHRHFGEPEYKPTNVFKDGKVILVS